jgi:hypothetical protein
MLGETIPTSKIQAILRRNDLVAEAIEDAVNDLKNISKLLIPPTFIRKRKRVSTK